MEEKRKEPAVQCKGIKKVYGKGEALIHALNDVSIEIYEGDLTMLVGPSGSGKTTLLSIMTGILTPDEGELTILGHNMKLMQEKEKALFYANNLGIVFQSLFLIPTLTVAENVSLPMLITNHPEKEAMDKAHKILKQLHIDHRATASPMNLSKGQQQRVAIARAMINDAKILICDEPTSALDHESGFEVMSLLREFAKKFLKAVLVVTHDHRIFQFSDRIINISDGQIEGNK